ncbi:hypothetical protein N0V95_007181 [Ascochyta clinopodiicola]|nr:hypothetical protein N0V95_007181 [Ascochyta clinopodiicola]
MKISTKRNPTRCLALFPSMEYFKWDCKKNTPDVPAVIYPKVSAVLYDSGACQTIESIYLFSKTIENIPYNECTASTFLSSDTTTIGDAPKDTVCYFETFSDSDCKTINDATELGGETSCKLQESRSYKYFCHAPYTFPTFDVGLYNNKDCQGPDSTIEDVVPNQCHDLADSNQIARVKATQQGVVRAGQCVLKVINANDCNGESRSNPPDQCTNAPAPELTDEAPELTDEAPVKSYFIFCKLYTG